MLRTLSAIAIKNNEGEVNLGRIIEFLKNTKIIYLIFFLIFIIDICTPVSSIRTFLMMIAITLIYLNMFIISITNANTILKIIRWLLIAPLIIGVVIAGYVSIWWTAALKDQYFVWFLLIVFVVSWVTAALFFELNKVEAAIKIINAIFATLLAFAFLTTLNSNFSTLIFDQSTINAAIHTGISKNSLVEIIVKLVTFPFIISSIWALLIIKLRTIRLNKT